ncbi:hypothetical protein MC7420_4627 [Coleofasciculus chthonoplastes PCC 7420]|uniref:Uncharacterized protein n=1 Tax=Coleofasciculus chthonoplastes PCC 7420 TaxID=118168 RepID=B4VP80_9CYAN|nr:hypothetical protein MC7420_4627 [Coleofasciculus chthonoplastes PCC 7420]
MLKIMSKQLNHNLRNLRDLSNLTNTQPLKKPPPQLDQAKFFSKSLRLVRGQVENKGAIASGKWM